MAVSLNYILTPEMRHAGYHLEFDGDRVNIILDNVVIDHVEMEQSEILRIRTIVTNHMETHKAVEIGHRI